MDVDSISKVVKIHIPSPPIETHSDDNIVGNWRSHSRHSIRGHTATNVMENINPNVPKVKFIAYNCFIRVILFNSPRTFIAAELIGTKKKSNLVI